MAASALAMLAAPASAYIDPGSGGYIISGMGSTILTLLGGLLAGAAGIFRKQIVERAGRNKAATAALALALLLTGAYLVHTVYSAEGVRDAGGLVPSATDKAPFNLSLSGAHVYDRAAAAEGFNLFGGKLMDMDGNVVHQWREVYGGVIGPLGNIVAQEYLESRRMGKYTWDDKPIWERDFPIHHFSIIGDGGDVYSLTKEVHTYNGRDVEFDAVAVMAPNGTETSRWSTWDSLKELQQFHRQLELDQPEGVAMPDSARLNTSVWGGHYDYYHLNGIQLLPENALSSQYKAFQAGNWLLSFRHGSMVFILDKDTKKVVWRAIYDQVEDNIEGPHCAQMLADGRILLFDNGRYRGWSRVIELDPVTLKVLWEYRSPGFYTLSQGCAQRLPNGNTLITESEEGHAFEITRTGATVWEYYNPDRQGPDNNPDSGKWGQRQEIARMTRYPGDFIERLMNKSET